MAVVGRCYYTNENKLYIYRYGNGFRNIGWLVAVVFYNMENYREQTTIAATDEFVLN
jgi:hypothetical protein